MGESWRGTYRTSIKFILQVCVRDLKAGMDKERTRADRVIYRGCKWENEFGLYVFSKK